MLQSRHEFIETFLEPLNDLREWTFQFASDNGSMAILATFHPTHIRSLKPMRITWEEVRDHKFQDIERRLHKYWDDCKKMEQANERKDTCAPKRTSEPTP